MFRAVQYIGALLNTPIDQNLKSQGRVYDIRPASPKKLYATIDRVIVNHSKTLSITQEKIKHNLAMQDHNLEDRLYNRYGSEKALQVFNQKQTESSTSQTKVFTADKARNKTDEESRFADYYERKTRGFVGYEIKAAKLLKRHEISSASLVNKAKQALYSQENQISPRLKQRKEEAENSCEFETPIKDDQLTSTCQDSLKSKRLINFDNRNKSFSMNVKTEEKFVAHDETSTNKIVSASLTDDKSVQKSINANGPFDHIHNNDSRYIADNDEYVKNITISRNIHKNNNTRANVQSLMDEDYQISFCFKMFKIQMENEKLKQLVKQITTKDTINKQDKKNNGTQKTEDNNSRYSRCEQKSFVSNDMRTSIVV
ncbi:MAG: hypothetical protein AB8B67_02510 [Rickettsiaceae bacterium]